MSAATKDNTGSPPPAPRLMRALHAIAAPLRFLFRPVVLALGLVIALGSAVALVAWCLLALPVDGGMAAQPGANASLVLETGTGDVFAARGTLRGDPIQADRLPQPLADAVVAIEDRRFRDHAGLDLRAVFRAGLRNATAGRTREGGSTITQQLARLQYLSAERTLLRKTQELLIALWLERQLSKDEILARYLSSAYFGAGAWGADAAARRYFGKAAGELTLAEAAMLAGLIRAPSQLAPTRNMEGARRRAELVLAAMVETGRASQGDADAARAKPAALQAPPEMAAGRGWFADWVEADVRRLLGPVPVDLAARTTLDPELQDLAERVVTDFLRREGDRARVGQAALVAMTHEGAVLAAVGGRDYADTQFNRVTQARRQPGSLFKLFVYGAALENGFNPDSPVVDRPVRIGTWEPQNFGGRFRGSTTLREAFAQSINTVAVQLSETVGRERVADVARRLGLRSELPAVPSVALGTAESTLLELTGTFASVAAGRRVDPHVVRAVRARDRALYTRSEPTGEPPLAPAVRQQLLSLLVGAVREGTGRTVRLQIPVAGKTGTTQEHRDAWFIAFTPDIVVGVWVGNDDNTPTNGVTGGELPARMWQAFVGEASRIRVAAPPAPQPAAAAAPPAPPAAPALRGRVSVLDTATLRVGGQVARLAGVIGFGGEYARDMAVYLAGREVSCTPAAERPGYHNCRAGDRDLAEVVLFNGGGRAEEDAPTVLLEAEHRARSIGRGIWAR
ncbi:PBP1A family penicillin-binding protein [Sabulicella rubraurantiaca]|uniref:PBP1A family penicillin-binding protein n=1 Tax=Sabulicella rubraurantiaca TaxID=2811429 RepID=UPI002E28E33F|nr:PBP1A family penicillin-binding protein [Sabulicella rubraurantiaca]